MMQRITKGYEAVKKKTVKTLELPMLVIEALFHNLHEQKISPDTMLQLSCRNRLGNISRRSSAMLFL